MTASSSGKLSLQRWFCKRRFWTSLSENCTHKDGLAMTGKWFREITFILSFLKSVRVLQKPRMWISLLAPSGFIYKLWSLQKIIICNNERMRKNSERSLIYCQEESNLRGKQAILSKNIHMDLYKAVISERLYGKFKMGMIGKVDRNRWVNGKPKYQLRWGAIHLPLGNILSFPSNDSIKISYTHLWLTGLFYVHIFRTVSNFHYPNIWNHIEFLKTLISIFISLMLSPQSQRPRLRIINFAFNRLGQHITKLW